MRPAFLIALCALPVMAHAVTWSKAGSTKDSWVYIDKASIRKEDAGRRAWTLESFKKPQTAPDGKQYLSVKALHLYDCAERSMTLRSQTFYPEAMAKGEAVGTYKFEAFDAEQVEPGTRYATAMNTVCGRAPAGKTAP
ncbi:surface-adhesin E family protein [Massilia sp. METH4]|uniref:surface-adhesin E family protein n=1 Tax=Massilia sp. METH4 TaxID=3123041 RepID=UPI0030D442CD